MINKDGKIFGKISIVDILTVIVIAAMAIGVYMRFFKTPETVKTDSVKITYTVRVEKIRDFTANGLMKKGKLYDSDTGEYLGEIKNVTLESAVIDAVTQSGDVRSVKYPERCDAVLTVEIDGSANSRGYYTEAKRALSVGGELDFETKYVDTSGTIVSVQ